MPCGLGDSRVTRGQAATGDSRGERSAVGALPPEAWPGRHCRATRGFCCFGLVRGSVGRVSPPPLLPARLPTLSPRSRCHDGISHGALGHWGRGTCSCGGTLSHIPRCSVPSRAAEPFRAGPAALPAKGTVTPVTWGGDEKARAGLCRVAGTWTRSSHGPNARSLSLTGLPLCRRPAPSRPGPHLQPDPADFATGFVGAEPRSLATWLPWLRWL